jgi:hypothetical protein
MLTREAAARIGRWPAPRDAFGTPSQASRFSAFRKGISLRFVPRIGVILVFAGARQASYAVAESADHAILSRWIRENPHLREQILEDFSLTAESLRLSIAYHEPFRAMVRWLLQPLSTLQEAVGLHPQSLQMALRYGWRGGFIRHIGRITGVR